MVAVAAATMNVAEALACSALEVITAVALPIVGAIRVVKGTIVPPIAVIERAVIAVIVAIIIVGARERHAYADANAADMDSDAYLGICSRGADQT